VIIIDFLMSNKDCDSQVLSGLLLKNFAFIFEDMDKRDPDGAYWSTFMLQLLGKAHLSAINGHVDIPVLKTQARALKEMAGVIALCAAAVSFFRLLTPAILIVQSTARMRPHINKSWRYQSRGCLGLYYVSRQAEHQTTQGPEQAHWQGDQRSIYFLA